MEDNSLHFVLAQNQCHEMLKLYSLARVSLKLYDAGRKSFSANRIGSTWQLTSSPVL